MFNDPVFGFGGGMGVEPGERPRLNCVAIYIVYDFVVVNVVVNQNILTVVLSSLQ